MSGNSSNSSSVRNQTGSSSGSSGSSRSAVYDLIQVPLLSLTILLAIFYATVILIRPAFRQNKLNWFTVNLCFASVALSIMMLIMTVKRIADSNGSSLPCRLQGFLLNMCTSQLMYSHSVIAVSRFLAIVYANKRIFRTARYIFSCMACGWLAAILAALPYLLIDGFACSSSSVFLAYFTLTFTLIVPALLVLLFNTRIFMFVRQSSRRVHAEGAGGGVSHARDMHLLKTMIVTFTVFVAGWFPLFLTQTFSERFPISSLTDGIFQILPPLSMLCDVILLIFINQPVRLFLVQLIRKQQQAQLDNTLANRMKTIVNAQLKS